jgi:hypothetical protein
MPILSIEPDWGAVFCCDGAGCGGVCDPWCEYADPVEQERFVRGQHLGEVDLSVTPGPYYCDDRRCCGPDEDDG